MLADPSCRTVIELLRERPRRAGELAARLALSAPAMSRHLRALRRSGLVKQSRSADDARARVYRLEPAALQPLRSWLDELSAYWELQLSAFKTHAEGAAGTARREPRRRNRQGQRLTRQ